MYNRHLPIYTSVSAGVQIYTSIHLRTYWGLCQLNPLAVLVVVSPKVGRRSRPITGQGDPGSILNVQDLCTEARVYRTKRWLGLRAN